MRSNGWSVLRLFLISFTAFAAAAFSVAATAGESAEAKIARAMSAAPAAVSQNATILDLDGTVLRSGSNGWHCLPGVAPGDDHPMCSDEVWMSLMQALKTKAGFKTDRIGISYMLQGDARVNNADPFDTAPNPGEVWVQEGPHLMILLPDGSALAGMPDDPGSGGPYVMWKGTPYAHVMVPVGPRQSSR